MIKVSDFIAKYLKEKYGITHLFMISGGGAMHLNNSFSQYMEYTCNHNEQASAIAAEGFAESSGKVALVNVTTGPGGINTLNGLFGQWTDSVPVIYISGQVKFSTTIKSCPELNLRQLGDQEVDIISIVKPLTKYAKMVTDPYDIKRVLDKALHLATSSRPGPVWIDVPMNVQGALIEERELREYIPEENTCFPEPTPSAEKVIRHIQRSKRPIIISGNGIRISETKEELRSFIEKTGIPVVSSFKGMELFENTYPYQVGRIGTVGQRAGNFNLQNADLVISLGSRNNIRQVSYNWENFACKAFKIIVDIDADELKKPTIKADLPIHADLKYFLPILNQEAEKTVLPSFKEWREYCLNIKKRYLPSTEKGYQHKKETINPYAFMMTLDCLTLEEEIFILANASPSVCAFQSMSVRKGQRFILNSGNASMGYELPAAIGASVANKGRRIICIAGDGSIMMNLQELQTIIHYNLPIKIFIINNGGYSSIRQTQNNFFNGRFTACTKETGVSTPDFCKLAKAFGFKHLKIAKPSALKRGIKKALDSDGAFICEILTDPQQIYIPKLSSEKLPDGTMVSKPLEDMYPFLDREEFNSNIISSWE